MTSTLYDDVVDFAYDVFPFLTRTPSAMGLWLYTEKYFLYVLPQDSYLEHPSNSEKKES